MLDFVLACKQGRQEHQLGSDAAQSEDVHRKRVVGFFEEDLGGSVPPGRDVVGLDLGRLPRLCKAKVRQLDVAVLIQKNVLGFDISVHDSLLTLVSKNTNSYAYNFEVWQPHNLPLACK